jgi:hypothetical protein
MIQLTYEPALDPFHGVFRLLRLRPIASKHGPLARDHVRVLDFYQLFPYRIDGIRLMPQHRKYRRLASEYQTAAPYGGYPEDRFLFNRMEPMQIAAFDTLASLNLIDPARWHAGEVAATSELVPEELAVRIGAANDRDAQLEEFLGVLASEYRLTGANGLKDRTGLMEHRHDAV